MALMLLSLGKGLRNITINCRAEKKGSDFKEKSIEATNRVFRCLIYPVRFEIPLQC